MKYMLLIAWETVTEMSIHVALLVLPWLSGDGGLWFCKFMWCVQAL